jgi:hypothetical protein
MKIGAPLKTKTKVGYRDRQEYRQDIMEDSIDMNIGMLVEDKSPYAGQDDQYVKGGNINEVNDEFPFRHGFEFEQQI